MGLMASRGRGYTLVHGGFMVPRFAFTVICFRMPGNVYGAPLAQFIWVLARLCVLSLFPYSSPLPTLVILCIMILLLYFSSGSFLFSSIVMMYVWVWGFLVPSCILPFTYFSSPFFFFRLLLEYKLLIYRFTDFRGININLQMNGLYKI